MDYLLPLDLETSKKEAALMVPTIIIGFFVSVSILKTYELYCITYTLGMFFYETRFLSKKHFWKNYFFYQIFLEK